MKYLILLLIAGVQACGLYAQASLKGKVYNASGSTLPGATIYIPDLKIAAITNSDGVYTINNLPKQKFLFQVTFIGYKTLIETIDLSQVTDHDFKMEQAVIEGHEVVVTGNVVSTDNEKSSVSVTLVDKKDLLSEASTNIIDAIAHTPGVSQITTGGAVSKPVIRGLAYNRIVTLSDGIRQEGQQWGDEHGIEIDEHAAGKIEILRGPSSLLYGSDAMGGVINFMEPVPPPVNSVQGEAATKFSANDRLGAGSLMLEGNRNSWMFRMRGGYKSAGPYTTPLERIPNSGFSETIAAVTAGVNKSWGYTRLHLGRYFAEPGLVEGERDSLGRFTDEAGNPLPASQINRRVPGLPFQRIYHTKATSVNRFMLGKSQLTVNAGLQRNERNEFEEHTDEPGLSMDLRTLTYDVKYFFPKEGNLDKVIGVGGMKQDNLNRGADFLIPDYGLVDAGIFCYVKKEWDRLTLSAGIRYDSRMLQTRRLLLDSAGVPSENGTDTLFEEFDRMFGTATGAIGTTVRLSEVINLKLNIGRGFRAPSLSELSANGVHEGTFRYEVGNKDLRPETSLQLDAGIKADNDKLCVEINLFRNLIDHFIYYRNLNGEMRAVGTDSFPVFRYTQGKALLQGFEFSFDVHLFPALHFENSISMVHAENRDTDVPLPFIPPVLIHNELRWDIKSPEKGIWKEPYLKISFDSHLTQNRVDIFETETKGYSLLNAAIGTDIRMGRQEFTFSFICSNIANTAYFDHLNRLKYSGIHNKGRNFTVQLLMPFVVKS